MTYTFAYRHYSLPFRTPMRTAHGVWTQREGLLVRLESETKSGTPIFGECAPIPWFGTETADEAAAACATLGARVTDEQLDAISARLPCLRFALKSTLIQSLECGGRGSEATGDTALSDLRMKTAHESGVAASLCRRTPKKAVLPDCLPVAALLPAGRAALKKIPAFSESGFRTFKWKVGVSRLAGAADEIALLDDVLAALPADARLRLDANGAWTRRTAERWLARCADYPIEFVEQPIAPAIDTKSSDDLLLGLANDYPTPLALDESVATAANARRWLQLGWPGIFVIKPSLLGDAAKVLAELPPGRTVFSSALETAVGAQAALRLAFRFYDEAKAGTALRAALPPALGFGAWPLFNDERFDGPRAAPFIHRADLDKIEPETLWNALS